MKIYFEEASSGELEKREIHLSVKDAEEFVSLLRPYSSKLTDDVLKSEFSSCYTVELNENTTLQINAEYAPGDELTYMFVQNRADSPILRETYIDTSIAAFLAGKA